MASPPEEGAPDLGFGPASEGPDDKSTPPAGKDAGVGDGTPAPLSDATNDESGPAPFDWKTLDLRRTKLDEVPETYRDMIAHFQKQVKDAQAGSTRRAEDLRRQEQELQQRQKELLELQKSLAVRPTQTDVADAQQQKSKVADLLDDPDIDPEVRNGLLLVQQAIEEALEPYKEVLDTVPQLREGLSSIQQERVQSREKQLLDQIREARDEYGEDIDAYADEIRMFIGLDENNKPVREPFINRATGKPHTVRSAYEFVAGITGKQAQQMRSEDQNIRDKSKHAAGVTAGAGVPAGAAVSEKEVLDQIRALGFGARR